MAAESEGEDAVAERPITGASRRHTWTRATRFEDFAVACCGRRHLHLLSDPDSFALVQRAGRMGPVTLAEIVVGSDMSMDCCEGCDNYRVLMLSAGRTECVEKGERAPAGPGTAAVFSPQDHRETRWVAGANLICFNIDRSAVDDALSDALGRQVTSQIEFTPILPITTAPAQSWINMLGLFKEQFFRPESLLNQPLIGMPFVDSLVRGLLLAAEHPYRDALAGDPRLVAPRAIRTAVDIIEAEAHLPLTLSLIAARCHVSARSLQLGFRRHLEISPMAYLRQVRLRRAHQNLLESDPSTVTVASVAYRWGFTNLGRFAAAHSARYGEPPVKTLRRKVIGAERRRMRCA
ncbi:AraC family transcriptional regulator [Mycobacterium sp. 1165196.3]|uniref:AraC family transcriptional regulator n=1 Tax=Mycobacterium sp. 1165196.3 TaxID=1834071 RepID=UPI003514070C